MIAPTGSTISEFSTALKSGNPTHIKLSFPNQNKIFTDADVSIDGGLTLTSYLNSEDDIVIGSAVMSEMNIKLLNNSSLIGFNWEEECELSLGVEIEGSTVWVSLGFFTGKKPERTVRTDIIDFTAYDRMQKFDILADEFLETLTYPITMGDIYHQLCSFVGLQYAYTSEMAASMALSYSECPFSSGMSCRAILSQIAEANCCMAKINTAGKVAMKWYTNVSSLYSISETDYFDINISEHTVTPIDSIRIASTEENVTGFVYPVSPVSNTYTIMDNPLLLALGTSDLTAFITSAITRFTNLGSYTPVYVSAIGNWLVETGDIIKVYYDNGSSMNMPVFNRQLHWIGASEDYYECTGNAKREELTISAKEKYELGSKLSNKYTIRSGIDIDDDGITVSGNRFVKIQSGGVLDVQSENFTIDSENGVVGSGNWQFDDSGLTLIEQHTPDYPQAEEHTLGFRLGSKTVPTGVESVAYIDLGFTDVYPSYSRPHLIFGLNDSKYIRIRHGDASDRPAIYPSAMHDVIIEQFGGYGCIGSLHAPFHEIFVDYFRGNGVKNDVVTADEGFVLDARQGKALADLIGSHKEYEFDVPVSGSVTKRTPGNTGFLIITYYGTSSGMFSMCFVVGSSTSADPLVKQIVAGTRITITSSAGNITIANSSVDYLAHVVAIRMFGTGDIS